MATKASAGLLPQERDPCAAQTGHDVGTRLESAASESGFVCEDNKTTHSNFSRHEAANRRREL